MILRSVDVFCHVIDNFGDAGVAYRFSREFQKKHPTCAVRLFIDNLEVLHALEPSIMTSCFSQDINGITIIDSNALTEAHVEKLGIASIVIEIFACDIPGCYLERALFLSSLIINLEYLSAESWTEGYHCRESLLPRGTAKKYFYMPGFTNATGGVLLNSDLCSAINTSAAQNRQFVQALLNRHGFPAASVTDNTLTGTVFTYERGFDTMLKECSRLPHHILLLCFGEKSHRSMRHSLERAGVTPIEGLAAYKNIHIVFMPFVPMHDYDTLLFHTDFNIVRGEDSLVRAILAGKPFIWNAYLQDEKYQKVKVEAFLSMMHPYFEDEPIFTSYYQLLMDFNNAPSEASVQCTLEDFSSFFVNLKKIEHSTKKLCYFIEQNCNLVEKLSDFIDAVQIQ